jgi:Na+/alanine symporter
MLFIAPVLFFALYQSVEENIFFLSVFQRTFNLLRKSWVKLFWNSIKIFFLLFIFFLLLSSPLVNRYVQNISMNFELEESTIAFIRLFMLVMIYIFLCMLFFAMQMSTSVFSYYACNEIVNAKGLHERIKKFGERNVLFGFEKEKQDV